MVYRKRKFTESNGRALMAALQRTLHDCAEARDHAPFGSEIYAAIDALCKSCWQVADTLTGGTHHLGGWPHSTGMVAPQPPESYKSWDTIPLWKQAAEKERPERDKQP